jgi:glutamine synthetase
VRGYVLDAELEVERESGTETRIAVRVPPRSSPRFRGLATEIRGVVSDRRQSGFPVRLPFEASIDTGGPGLWNVGTEREILRAAADGRVMVLKAIRGVAHKMDLETTMAPKPYLDAAGNGHHLHVSLYEGEDPVLFDRSGP